MRKQLKESKSAGFTIIEVMIVLAIAGVILLIVLLVIPTLNRGNRNTQRRDDVAKLAALVQESANNNNGDYPASCIATATTCFLRNTNLGFFDETAAETIFVLNTGPAAPAALGTADLTKVQINTWSKCGANGIGQTAGATKRSAIAQFVVESNNSGAVSPQCQDI